MAPPGSKKDETYFFEDGDVVLIIENVLFKVHVAFLKHYSEIFEHMAKLPQGNDKEGSENKPIHLEQHIAANFRLFCRVMYHGSSICKYALEPKDDNIKYLVSIARDTIMYGLQEMHNFILLAMRMHAPAHGKLITECDADTMCDIAFVLDHMSEVGTAKEIAEIKQYRREVSNVFADRLEQRKMMESVTRRPEYVLKVSNNDVLYTSVLYAFTVCRSDNERSAIFDDPKLAQTMRTKVKLLPRMKECKTWLEKQWPNVLDHSRAQGTILGLGYCRPNHDQSCGVKLRKYFEDEQLSAMAKELNKSDIMVIYNDMASAANRMCGECFGRFRVLLDVPVTTIRETLKHILVKDLDSPLPDSIKW
ncbi:hypothetical protein BD410DRAFT_845024 [Rickenella mellea]|uniref:BTB domain-containing protein n=1 Tax=Rickenella mellea TaxID=50990 RepID=A0A4Y7PK97_9AGAM|nr:hypothetical protein BD410DRAFT_845024 [Rickenella mellea]